MTDRTGNHAAGSAPASAAQASSNDAQGSSTATPKPSEKTISCVSCRRRKLKCDRVKPKCGTCERLRHECEYPARRRNLGSRRRNMKELEERLAQVETKLVVEQNMPGKTQYSATQIVVEPDWNAFADNMDMPLDGGGFLDDPLNMPSAGYGFESLLPSISMGNLFSQDLIGLGLQEPLPPQDMIDDLYAIYFEKFHPFIPMMHKLRFFASLDRAPHMRPPVCLLYAMWAIAASTGDKYSSYEDLFYERARRYIEAAEMKGFGETFVSLYHAQAWALIGHYEAKKAYFSRSWMSIGRTVRLAQMLGLNRVDGMGRDVKRILPPPRDWIEREERRRTFWAAYYGDRWASGGTGWPMVINEDEILTNLPASEESFESGVETETISLERALAAQGASHITPYGGVILSAALFGHNFQHLHRTSPNERPGDIANGEFWKRHRKMDNVLSNTFMFLPDHLRLPYALRDMNIVFLHMNIHASSICLHQAAVITAERYKTGASIILQSKARSLAAAEEISNLMRLVSHVDASDLNSWMGFCLYLAGGVFLQNKKIETPHPQSLTNLEFLLAAMKALAKRHPLTNHFVAQLELDIEASGTRDDVLQSLVTNISLNHLNEDGFPKLDPVDLEPHDVPNYGLLATREGAPMNASEPQKPSHSRMGNDGTYQSKVNSLIDVVPLYGIYPANTGDKIAQNPNAAKPPYVDPWSTHGLDTNPTIYDATSEPGTHAFPPITPMIHGDAQLRDSSPRTNSDSAPTLSGTTPSSDSSNSNTKQFPYRQSDRNSQPPSALPQHSWPEGANPFSAPLEWTMTQDDYDSLGNQPVMSHPNDYLDETIWNHDHGPG